MLAALAARLRRSRAARAAGEEGVEESFGFELEGEDDPQEGPVRVVLGEDCSVM